MMNVSTGALCAESDPEVARLLAELSQIGSASFANTCPQPPSAPPVNRLVALARENKAAAAAEASQCVSYPSHQAPTEDASQASEGDGNSLKQHPKAAPVTASKKPARAAGSKTGKGKVGRPPRLSPLTMREALARGPFTATELAAARLSKMPARLPRLADAVVETFWHLRWEDLSPAQKLTVATWQIARAGGRAFSLNLSAEREAELRARRDPRDRMAKLLRDHLRADGFGELPIAWVFEVTPSDAQNPSRLHLHGVIGGTLDFTEDDVSRLDKALCKAGGEAYGATGGKRQTDLTPLAYAPGWASYMLEAMSQTAADLRLDREDLIHISHPTRKAATAHFALLTGRCSGFS